MSLGGEAVSFFGYELQPGSPNPISVPSGYSLSVSHFSLPDPALNPPSSTVVSVSVQGSEGPFFVVCHLTAGRCESIPVCLAFPETDSIAFKVRGNPVGMTGTFRFVDEDALIPPPFDMESSESEMEVDDEEEVKTMGKKTVASKQTSSEATVRSTATSSSSVLSSQRKNADKQTVQSTSSSSSSSTSLSGSLADRISSSKETILKTFSQASSSLGDSANSTNSQEKNKKPVPQAIKDSKNKDEKQTKQSEDSDAKKPKTIEGGVVIQDLVVGSGAGAKKFDRVSVHYRGTLKNGKQFDTSRRGKNPKPFTFRLGAGKVIRGWDVGVVGMRVGGRRTLRIPSAYAYGKQGAPPDIPRNADLVFDVELVRIG